MAVEQGGPGGVLALFKSGQASTRADVVRLTGLARATATQRIHSLVNAGWLRATSESTSTGGRPPARFEFNASGGVFLVADIGGTSPTHMAATDLDGKALAHETCEFDLASGPEPVLDAIAEANRRLIREIGSSASEIRGVGIALPGPVEFATGRVVSPPIMPGWDGFDVRGYLGGGQPYPVLVDNDVNAQAYGEQRTCWPEHRDMLMIEVGTGIGCGIMVDGELYRGALGAAGDLGHIPYAHGEGLEGAPVCRCGNVACVEAYAGGWALARDLSAGGHDVRTTADVVELIRSGHPDATTLIRQAARIIGWVVSDAVSLLNPSLVIVGGVLTLADKPLLAGIREVVYRHALPLATRNLEITVSRLGEEAGLKGLTLMLEDLVLDADAVDRQLRAGS